MEEEVRHLVGERSQPQAERAFYRWGKEQGYGVIDGQKVNIRRTRVRSKEGGTNGRGVTFCSSNSASSALASRDPTPAAKATFIRAVFAPSRGAPQHDPVSGSIAGAAIA